MFFESIKLRIFLARIQAELKAQHDDQKFVNRICQHPANLERIDMLRKQAYYRKDNIAPFLVVCNVLRESLFIEDFSIDDRKVCAALLAMRLEKAATNPQFRMRHIMIFGDLEETVSAWAGKNIQPE